MTFSHELEEQVFEDRLIQLFGKKNILREELRALGHGLETWLKASSAYDLPLLIKEAKRVLNQDWPKSVDIPQAIWILSVEQPESLEQSFLGTLRAVHASEPVSIASTLRGVCDSSRSKKKHFLKRLKCIGRSGTP